MTVRITKIPNKEELEDHQLFISTVVQKLMTSTDAEIDTFVDNQTADLPPAADGLVTINKHVLKMLKRLLKFIKLSPEERAKILSKL